MVEQRGQVRIILLVVDDEAGVDRDLAPVVVDGDGVAVAARAQLPVVDGDGVAIESIQAAALPAIPVPITATRIQLIPRSIDWHGDTAGGMAGFSGVASGASRHGGGERRASSHMKCS